MSVRRWQEGDSVEVSGVAFRIVLGRKWAPNGGQDLRLETLTAAGWRPVDMALGFFLADFFGENEDVLYPPGDGNKGGRMYLGRCSVAYRDGWEVAVGKLAEEKRQVRLFDGHDDAAL